MSRTICAVLLVTMMVLSAEAISFQDLVDRAEAADKPKPIKEEEEAPKLPTLSEVSHKEDMMAWSTDHLLGLDSPPPADFMAQLIPDSVRKAAVKKAKEPVHKTTVKKAAVKKVAKPVKHVAESKVSHPSDIVPENDKNELVVHPFGNEDEQYNLLHPGKPLKDADHHESFLAPPDADSLLVGNQKPKKTVKRKPKIASHKVTEENEGKVKEETEPTHKAAKLAVSLIDRLRHRHQESTANKLMNAGNSAEEHKPPSANMLSGFASSLMRKARQASAKQAVFDAKKKSQADALAKQRERIEQEGDEAAGGPLPDLDLSGDEAPATSAPKKDIPSLDNFLNIDSPADNDDDDFLQTDSW